MPNGVTNFSSKIKFVDSRPDGSVTARYTEVAYNPMDFVQVLVQSTSALAATIRTQVGTSTIMATGDGSSTSNIAGMAVTSGGPIDFTMRMPVNFDTTQTSYADIYYFLTGAGTKGDIVSWAGAYNNISANATTTALATAGTTTGITNPTARTLATSKANGYLYKDTITVAANTFTADTLPQVRITPGGTYTAPELRLQKVVHRYARLFL